MAQWKIRAGSNSAARVGERQVEADGDRPAARADALGEPGGDRAVAAADLQGPGARTDAERLELPAVQRVEQLGHQRQPRALTVEVMAQDVVRHPADPMSRTNVSAISVGAGRVMVHP